MLYILVIILASMMVLGTVVPALADIEDYIQTICEQNSGKWSDKNMACNDFESEGEQWNFADALMDRKQYDKLVKYCEGKGGEWSDEKVKCYIEDEEDRTAFEDQVCDKQGEFPACSKLSATDTKIQDIELAFASNNRDYNEESCEDYYGDWEKGVCKFRGHNWEANEDFFYKAVCKGDDSKKCEKHRLSIQDGT
jgi:hypothetical protein